MKKIIASLFTAALIGGTVTAASAYAAEAELPVQSVSDRNVSAQSKSELYTTKDVESELRLRAEADTTSEITGTIPAGSLFSVLSIDGDWAAAEYGSSKGYVSTAYIRKITDSDSGITIEGVSSPEWFMAEDAGWELKGSISSKLVIKRVWGGVYKRDGVTEVLTAQTSPEADSFDISGFFNKQVDISKVGKGSYTYKLFAEDTAGKVAELISSDFAKLGTASEHSSVLAGDVDRDGKLTGADAEFLQKYLIGDAELSTVQYLNADTDRDMRIDAFDLVLLRQDIAEASEAPAEQLPEGWSVDEAGTYTTKNVTSYLNIRETASTSANALGTIPANAKFNVTRLSKDWAYAEYNGVKGYVSAAYIQKYTEPSEVWSTDEAGIYVTSGVSSVLNVLESPESGAKVLGAVPNGAKFRVTKTSQNWVYVDYKELQGYMPKSYVKLYVEPVTEPVTSEDYTTLGVVDNLNIRASQSTSAYILGTIPAGAVFKVTNVSEGWASAEYNGVKGYVSSVYIQKYTEPSEVWSTDEAGIYVTSGVSSVLNVLESPESGAKVLGTVPNGAKFRVTKTSQNWIYVDYKELQGYMPKSYAKLYVEPEEVWSTDEAGIYVTSGVSSVLNVLESPESGAKVLGAVPNGAKFRVTKTSQNWVYVDYKELQGYMPKSYAKLYVEPVTEPVTSEDYTTLGVVDYLNIRASQSTSADILGTIPAGAVFKATSVSGDWASAEYNGVKGYVSSAYIQKYDPENQTSVMLNVMEFNQHPNYPTGCESAALYMLLRYYNVSVTMEQIVNALPKGPLPYYQNGVLYGANPETEFVGDPHNSYSYGVFNEPMAKVASNFKGGVQTKKGSSIDEIVSLLKEGKPVMAWYTTTPGKDIYYNDSWYDYKTGKLIRWPAGEHAVVVCGFNSASQTLTYRDPNTGSTRTVSYSLFNGVFTELGSRILYY